jgi:hypothetical protein
MFFFHSLGAAIMTIPRPATHQEQAMLKKIQSLIDQGMNAYHISQVLKNNGYKVYCFGSYYTVGKSNRVAFYATDNGVKCAIVNS